MNRNEYKIRPFKPADQVAVIDLWKICKLIRPWNSPEKDIQRELDVQSDLFLVLEIRKNINGSVMAAYDGHRGVVNYLAIHPSYQKKGFGRIIMKYVETELIRRGCPKIKLLARSENHIMSDFYNKLLYQEQSDVKGFGKRLISDTK